ncbi:MAG TPA: hypothetical protein VET66_04545, partial [Steroidobacteraceae bacterium]|nr:hypothetical protein [Steroidobacteraceae bacterium]
AAFAAARAGRPGWAGALAALALVKPQLTWLPAAVVLAIAWRGGGGRRALAAFGGTLAGLLALSLTLRPRWLGDWLRALGEDARQGGTGAAALRANMGTLPAVAAHLPGPLGGVLLVLAVAAGALILAWQVRRSGFWREPPASGSDLLVLAEAICLVTALSPWTWIYDGVFWLVPVVVALRISPAWRGWAALAVFWVLPWTIRVAHVATARGGTPLNHLEDALIAPLLLALLCLPPRSQRAAIPAAASRPATLADRRR